MLLIAPLREHAPFDEMEPRRSGSSPARLQLAYHPRGQLIVGPDERRGRPLYIVKQGRVRSAATPTCCSARASVFPVGALIGRRATDQRVPRRGGQLLLGACRPRISTRCSSAARASAPSAPTISPCCWSARTARCAPRRPRPRSTAPACWRRCASVAAPRAGVLRRGNAAARGRCSACSASASARWWWSTRNAVPVGIFTTRRRARARRRAAGGARRADRRAHDAARRSRSRRKRRSPTRRSPWRATAFRHVVVTRDGRLDRRGVGARPVRAAAPRPASHRERIRGRGRARSSWWRPRRDIRQLARQLLAQGVAAGAAHRDDQRAQRRLTRRVIELAAARARAAAALVLARARQRGPHGADAASPTRTTR